MSDGVDQNTRVGVLAAPVEAASLEDATWSADDAVVLAADDPEDALAELLEYSPEVIVAAGDDRFVGRLVRVYQRRNDLKTRPMRLYPCETSGSARLAAEVGAERLSPGLIRRLVKRARQGRLKRHTVGSLKVVVSSEPAERIGFSVGAGIFFKLFEAYRRAQSERSGRLASTLFGFARETILAGGRNLEPVGAKVAIDHVAEADSFGYMICSSLSTTWLGLKMSGDERPAMRIGGARARIVKANREFTRAAGFFAVRSRRRLRSDRCGLVGRLRAGWRAIRPR